MDERRNKGQFYTPTLFVDYAHKMIAEQFGEDWKEKYVVWDNCAGTKNLTRDYYFKELYCSTLENAELAISERYNREATSFQFDFLNDSLDKLPQGLKDALENNKPIIFFINPPYATASLTNGSTKAGISNTKVYEEMKAMKMGRGAQNLYAQFLYRIAKIKEQYNLTDIHIGLFSPTNFISSPSFKKIREKLFTDFSYSNGMFFKASHFADVADSWGILFSIWNGGKNDKNEFITKIVDNVDGEIVEIEDKTIYNCDNEKTASDWVKESVKKVKTFDAPNFTNALKIKTEKTSETNELGKIAENAIGFFTSSANNVYKSRNYIGLFTSAYSDAVGCSILPSNYEKVCSFFSARDLCKKDWQYAEDEFLIPNEGDERYNEFVNDSIVYSIFSTKSQQSSLRQVEYKGKLWDIKNEFFFMSKKDIMEMANENNFDFTWNDANVSGERYVYTKLQGITLSKEAQAVFDKAIELTKKSFKYRELFNEEHPEYQIMNWDCGWYQIKGMLKEYMPNELKEFTDLYKKLADKMRPMVYELGFLK